MTTVAIRCCLNPDPGCHSSYCTSTRPSRTVDRVGPGPFGTWSDQQVLESLQGQVDLCVRISEMTPEQRHHIGKKGEASPEQAGALNAVIATLLLQECRHRGI